MALSKISVSLYSSKVKHIQKIRETEAIRVWTNKPKDGLIYLGMQGTYPT